MELGPAFDVFVLRHGEELEARIGGSNWQSVNVCVSVGVAGFGAFGGQEGRR